jgi:ABC-type bacteriocin/lantibiotic exporter with double-glycine peptidase domain
MKVNNPITPLKRFFNLLKVEKQEIFSIYVYALFNGIVALSLPLGIQAIINLIGSGQVSTSWVLLVVLVILGVGLSGVMKIMQLTISENLQQKIFTRSAFEFAYRIPRIKMEALKDAYAPELVNRFFDTISLQKGLSKILIDFSTASLQVFFGLILLSFYHPFFILFSVILVVVVYLIFRFTAPQGLRTSLEESKKKYAVVHWLEEVARTMETFKLAGKSPLPMDKTDALVAKYLSARKSHFKTLLIQYINLVGFKVIVAAGLLLIGGLLVINQQMNIGQFVAAEIIIILVLASVEKLILSMETIYDVLTSVEKIGAITDLPLDDDKGTKASNIENGLSIKTIDLSYRFENEKTDMLKEINLQLKAGDKVCLSGYNGSGKSLLLQTLACLLDNYSGSISYNNIPSRNWSKPELHILIGDSLSKEDIFEGTVLENITLNIPNTSIEDIQKCTETLGLSKIIEQMPLGFDTPLMAEGKDLPKSVKLRIIHARSIVGKPRLILLGDDFNQLKGNDKNRFIQYLLNSTATVIVTSNDPQVAQQFERSIVLENGRVIGNNSYTELRKEPWFNSIFQTI